jgi:hypothetical protein
VWTTGESRRNGNVINSNNNGRDRSSSLVL